MNRLSKLKRLYWWIKYRTTSRFHIVKTNLEPGYHDTDERMLHACFELLRFHVEEELGTFPFFDEEEENRNKGKSKAECGLAYLEDIISYNDDNPDLEEYEMVPEEQLRCAKETKDLYLWWTKEYLNWESPYEKVDVGDDVALRKAWELEQARREEEEANLIRLMKIRTSLWL